MARMTAQEVIDKWAAKTSAASGDYTAGINRVQQAPGQKAAAKLEKMRAGIMQALDSGKWSNNVSAVSLQDWKAKATGLGAQRLGPGVTAAKTKMVPAIQRLLNAVDASKALVDAMPDNTFEERLQKMQAWAMAMRAQYQQG